MAGLKADSSALGVGAFLTRRGWVAAVCSGEGLRGLSVPQASLDDAILDCLKKAGQALSEGERTLLGAIVRAGTFVPGDDKETVEAIEEWLARVEDQVSRFYAGKKVGFDVPLDWPVLSPFQRRILEEVRKIPWGETKSYGWCAKRLGNPKGARAVGAALARNPFPPVVPCHRVIRGDGMPGGYSGGEDLKRTLLETEETPPVRNPGQATRKPSLGR